MRVCRRMYRYVEIRDKEVKARFGLWGTSHDGSPSICLEKSRTFAGRIADLRASI